MIAGGSRELTAQLQQRIDSTVMRQIGSGEPVCFQAFVDAQEWLDDNNRCVRLFIFIYLTFVFCLIFGSWAVQTARRLLRLHVRHERRRWCSSFALLQPVHTQRLLVAVSCQRTIKSVPTAVLFSRGNS
jgi:hypothetical protein